MMKFGIGQPVRRFEDVRLLTGNGRFQDDQSLARQSNPNIAYKAGGEFVDFTRDKIDPLIKLIDRATGILEKSFGLKNPFLT